MLRDFNPKLNKRENQREGDKRYPNSTITIQVNPDREKVYNKILYDVGLFFHQVCSFLFHSIFLYSLFPLQRSTFNPSGTPSAPYSFNRHNFDVFSPEKEGINETKRNETDEK